MTFLFQAGFQLRFQGSRHQRGHVGSCPVFGRLIWQSATAAAFWCGGGGFVGCIRWWFGWRRAWSNQSDFISMFCKRKKFTSAPYYVLLYCDFSIGENVWRIFFVFLWFAWLTTIKENGEREKLPEHQNTIERYTPTQHSNNILLPWKAEEIK